NPDITDSKLLSHKQRESLIPLIKDNALAWGLGSAEPSEIDRINILQASLLAMARALQSLELDPDYLLIDGIHKIPVSYLDPAQVAGEASAVQTISPPGRVTELSGGLPCQKTVKQGDRLSVSIAAASILAKVTRDQMMNEYDSLYPEYGFAGHKGYGSVLHLRAIEQHGPSPIHRRTFRPVRDLLAAHEVDGQPSLGRFRG
nr:ribonuclease HII [Deltaproteobacteria bacterium]